MNNMDGGSILLITPKAGDFYLDITDELSKRGYVVDVIADLPDLRDPDFVRGIVKDDYDQNKKLVLEDYRKYWIETLSDSKYNKVYDILLVIDGRRLHPILFEELRKRNPSIRCINYLFDTTRSIYRFNINFQYFDKVVTFDQTDAKEYGLELLPIPWKECKSALGAKYTFFALGAYIPSRFDLFKFVKNIADENSMLYYMKIYIKKVSLYPLKYIASCFMKRRNYIKPSIYYSSFTTHLFISKDDFMKLMQESEIIVDSIDERQDGLTAHCTWALGAEKKIITNNASIASYDFYTPEQIFIVSNYSDKTKTDLIKFTKTKFTMDESVRQSISKFRIDNWVTSILS